ncbi:acetyl transferase [Cytophaga hutchinsonii ATCC 33406]|uniref:Acetyl transferase n=2 Tax=Cytophaga hutchinsonii TaxID=985 RepID=A0A6N4SUF7_CYTH3|nr:acetyl transferase [Cytophaga hutchinsonii ATCC 33406]
MKFLKYKFMKRIIEKLIQFRNPVFKFDSNVSSYVLLILFCDKAISVLRGLKILLYFKRPKLLMLGRSVRFMYAQNIVIGKFVKLDDGVYLSGLGKGKLTLANNVSIGAYSRIIVSTSLNNIGEYIHIGNNVGIGEFAYLGGGGGLEIGDDCIIGQYLSCHPENHNYDSVDTLIRHQGVSRQGIVIGKNCWIGSKVTILDGVHIGNNCVIAAGAVVTKSVPDNSVVGGVPARVLKSRISDK